MHHLEAVVSKQRSKKAESLPSRLRRISRDIRMEFISTSGSASNSLGIRWVDRIPPGVEDPQNLGQSEWDQMLGKIECVYSLSDKMRWKWHDVNLHQGLPNSYSPSFYPPQLALYPHTTAIATWRRTWRPWTRLFGDALGGWDRASLMMHLETAWLSELRDAHGGRDWARLEMNLVAKIKWTQRCTWKP